MNIVSVNIPREDVHKLLSAGSGDAALLYIYLQSGNALADAAGALRLNETRYTCALSTLRQLGLCREEQKHLFLAGEKPTYSEQDVLHTMDNDPGFRSLYGEVQRRLGRSMTTEELKILLSFVNYLGLPADVICVLVSFCQERARMRGSSRNPSLRTIEKEAYAWAEQGIDTLEAAAAFIHRQNVLNSRLSALMRQLQIHGRNLTAAEEKYARQWLSMGLEDELIAMAYEKTCLNTGGLNWAYMHKILLRWKDAGYRTADDVRKGDRKPGTAPTEGKRELDADELAAIQRMLQED